MTLLPTSEATIPELACILARLIRIAMGNRFAISIAPMAAFVLRTSIAPKTSWVSVRVQCPMARRTG